MPLIPHLADPASLDDMLLARLRLLLVTAGAMVTRLFESDYGITRREWSVLAWLAQAGEMKSSELATRSHVDRTRTSRTVGTLVAKKLVGRERRQGHGTVLLLTEQGRALYEALLPRTRAIQRELLDALPGPDDVQRLAQTLGALQAQAERMVSRQAQSALASGDPAASPMLVGLPNLGPQSQRMLAAAGIHTLDQLRQLGAVPAYRLVKQACPRASLNLLWALEGVLIGEPWQKVVRTHRTRLLMALDDAARSTV